MIKVGLLIAAVVLFIIAAIPSVPYNGTLLAAGLACFAASDLSI